MLGGNNNNPLPVITDENRFHFHSDASNQLQLFGNLQGGCSVTPAPANFIKDKPNNQIAFHPNKRGKETEYVSVHQKLQMSLNYNMFHDDADRSVSLLNQNPVSTGLRLSFNDDDEHNSSVTSASGSMNPTPSIILSLGDNIRTELDRQNEELDQYIKFQEAQLAKGVRDMKQRHVASLLTSLEKGVTKKLREKDLEIENMNTKNRELAERIKQASLEAQNWHIRAKYNESVVNVLKNKLHHAISKGVDQGKEGFGDSELDDTASYIDPINYLNVPGKSTTAINNESKNHMLCKGCKAKEVCILVMPCRHLCLCKECEEFVGVCPVCLSIKTGYVQVYLS